MKDAKEGDDDDDDDGDDNDDDDGEYDDDYDNGDDIIDWETVLYCIQLQMAFIFFVLARSSRPTDGRTDGRTDRHSGI